MLSYSKVLGALEVYDSFIIKRSTSTFCRMEGFQVVAHGGAKGAWMMVL